MHMLNILGMIILIIILFIIVLLLIGIRISLIYDKKGSELKGCLKILIFKKIKVYSTTYPSEKGAHLLTSPAGRLFGPSRTPVPTNAFAFRCVIARRRRVISGGHKKHQAAGAAMRPTMFSSPFQSVSS